MKISRVGGLLIQRWRREWPIVALVSTFVVLGVIYSTTVPLWEAPDEPANFGYIAHLVETRSLPMQRDGVLDASHHPPLYYATSALVSGWVDYGDLTGTRRENPDFVWAPGKGHDHNSSYHSTAETFPYRGIALAAHLARWVSVAAGAATVTLTYAITRRMFPEARGLALIAASVVALNPQYLFITSSIIPDSMVAMVCTLVLWQLLRTLHRPSQWTGWALTGGFCGLAMLAKSNAFVVCGVCGIMLVVAAARHRSWRLLWQGAVALGGAFLLVSGWWFARNWVLYGDPLGWQTFLSTWSVARRHGTVNWRDVSQFLITQLQSYWARFGWMTISAPRWFYWAVQVLLGSSLIGWIRWLWRRRWRSLEGSRQLGLVALVLLPVLQEAFQFRTIFTFDSAWYQGRHLFPIVAPVGILLAVGLWRVVEGRIGQSIAAVFAVGLLVFAATAPFLIIQPEYHTPTLAKWQAWVLPHRSDVTFGEQLRMRGYRASHAASPEYDVTLTLYWQAVQDMDVDYSAFVHIVDSAGALIAQSDVGLGSDVGYPSSAWWVEDIIPSNHVVAITPDILERASEIRVGVYFWADGERLAAVENGECVGDYVILDLSTLE